MAALESSNGDENGDEKKSEQQRHSRTIMPQRNDNDNNGSDDDEDDDSDEKSSAPPKSSPTITNTNPIDHLLTNKIPPSYQRTSTSKLMSKSTNGGGGNGADWNEEYRWDNLQNPMESALVLKLCTRLAPTAAAENYHHHSMYYNTATATGGGGGGGSGASSKNSTIGSSGGYNNYYYNDDSTSSDLLSASYDNTTSEDMSHLTSGIRGLWRKGKEQYVEHTTRRSNNKSSLVVTQKEQQAANVAQFLMKSGGSGSTTTGSGGIIVQQEGMMMGEQEQQQKQGSSDSLTMLQNQNDLVEYQQKWSDRRGGNGGESIRNDEGMTMDTPSSSESMKKKKKKKKSQQQPKDDTLTVDDHHHYSEGLCLGTLSIPFNKLPLEDAVCGNGAAVVERWYQLDDPNSNNGTDNNNSVNTDAGSAAAAAAAAAASASSGNASGIMEGVGGGGGDDEPTLLHGPRRCPSVLLEITFASAEYLDEAEDEIHRGVDGGGGEQQATMLDLSAWEEKESGAPATTTPVPSSYQEEEEKKSKKKKGGMEEEVKKPDEPELEPGVVDFVCIIGAKDIGDQRNDDGSKGWVESTPECCVLERFPPNDEFHINNGRMTGLIPQVEWFCFPEGCKLWRGPNAPTRDDLKAGGVSTMNHPSLDFSSSNFDTCLDAASSFSWFVLSSNSDVYGSKLVKTYGTIVRFYVPAPKGVDPRQDDFAQMLTGGGVDDDAKAGSYQKRLWVPIGICLTTVRRICYRLKRESAVLSLPFDHQLGLLIALSPLFRLCRLLVSSKKYFCAHAMQCNHSLHLTNRRIWP